MQDKIIMIITESSAVTLFFAIALLLFSAVVCGKMTALVKLPKVVGEILGGFLMSPTMLGRFFPEIYHNLFWGFEGQGLSLSVFYWLGLAFLMFSSGYEANFEDVKNDKRIIGWLIVGATIPPLILGYLVSDYFFVEYYLGAAGNRLVFNIIFAISVAVTSLPVISKIFMDLGIIRHRFARIILATATVQDLFLWVILSVSTSIITNDAVIFTDIVLHIGITLIMFFLAMFILPILKPPGLSGKSQLFQDHSFVFLVCLCIICIGGFCKVNIMYSAFVAGMVYKNLCREEAVISYVNLKNVSLSFFTPIYFAIVGIRLHITSDFSVGRFLAFLIIASALELCGCIITMKCIKLDWLSSVNLGVAMNARGGPGIVLASVTYDLGVINYEFFCVLIFVVLITSAIAGYWIDFVNQKGKLLSILE